MNRAIVLSSAATGCDFSKNLTDKIAAELPKIWKSYHSITLPTAAATITRRKSFGTSGPAIVVSSKFLNSFGCAEKGATRPAAAPAWMSRLCGLLLLTVTFIAFALLKILVRALSLVALVTADGAAFRAAIDDAVAGVPVSVASATVSHSRTPSLP